MKAIGNGLFKEEKYKLAQKKYKKVLRFVYNYIYMYGILKNQDKLKNLTIFVM